MTHEYVLPRNISHHPHSLVSVNDDVCAFGETYDWVIPPYKTANQPCNSYSSGLSKGTY